MLGHGIGVVLHQLPRGVDVQGAVRRGHAVVVGVSPVAPELAADLEAVERNPSRLENLGGGDPGRTGADDADACVHVQPPPGSGIQGATQSVGPWSGTVRGRHAQSRERRRNAASASGAKTSVKMTDQTTDITTGCCSGHAASETAGPAFPQSSRRLAVSDETGFHSAMKRSHEGMSSVGAKVFATKVSGNITVNMKPFTASTDLNSEPTQMPSQIIEKPNSSSRRNARAASETPLRIRPPIRRPVTAITTMPMLEWIRLDTLRPISTEEREIGSDLKRSTIPFSRSLVSPSATIAEENTIVWAMIPGSRNSRYVAPSTAIEPPKT